jgi:hypothetical protein
MCPLVSIACRSKSRVWPALLALALLVLASACGPPRASRDSRRPEQGPGLVYAYGRKLEGPYIFRASEDGNTLYLNDLVYSGPGEAPPPKIEVPETVRLQHELSVRASEESRRAETYEERKAIYADVLRGSELVISVREFSQGVYVTWRSSPDEEEEVILPKEESQFDPAEFRIRLISEFWNTVNSGGMIAFGRRYHIYVPAMRVPKTVKQIELIRSGASRDQLDVRSTALQNDRFLDDIYLQATEE